MKRITKYFIFLSLSIAVSTVFFMRAFTSNSLQARAAVTAPLSGERPAPSFPAELDWLNIGDRKLTLEKLRGKIVLLDFWTYGCINCVHVIPDLKRLEKKYAEELVVIGVHSAKFEQEGKTNNIRRLVMRYELEHAVVNDKDMQIWRSFGVRAWPTMVLIDPLGRIVGGVSGEGQYDVLDQTIQRILAAFDQPDDINRDILPLELEKDRLAAQPLLFPGKVLADEPNGRIFISDSNHHRIVEADLDGKVTRIFGGSESGFRDGDELSARFAWPQGLSLAGDYSLYVADSENHVLRHIDLVSGHVTTVAGTGEQKFQTRNQGPARETAINSPWDVLHYDGLIYIAMAGQHQIWRYDPAKEELVAFAGSRREELRDGPRLQAGLNQPSGLTTDGEYLYIADSEASAIRRVDLTGQGRLETIVGKGLFDFGDMDGRGGKVRLQHPLGIAYWANGNDMFSLVLADTYNSKLKWLDPKNQAVRTIAVTAGLLDEPGGLSISGDHAYIADTNHHAIKVLHLEKQTLWTLYLTDTTGRLMP